MFTRLNGRRPEYEFLQDVMMQPLLSMRRYRLRAIDKDLGHVEDFFFDDRVWKVRYIEVDTGNWLPGRQVLIGPEALEAPDREQKVISVSLTSAEVEDSPGIESDLPFSLKKEQELRMFFNWREYWNEDLFLFPAEFQPVSAPGGMAVDPSLQERGTISLGLKGNPHLRSANEVQNYSIRAKDGEIGHVEDFLMAEETWDIRYLTVDTGNWLPGKHVLIARRWGHSIDWRQQLVEVDLPRELIENSPEYHPDLPLSREYEIRLFQHYGRPYDVE